MNNNPFAVQTPEDISAEDAYHLFVDVFTDFYQVPNVGHSFLHGPRGSGKSMMFRYMMPDCQQLRSSKPIHQLDYFSIYIPIKKTALNLSNLDRLDNNAQHLINEHLLIAYITLTLFEELSKLFQTKDASALDNKEFNEFFKNDFIPALRVAGLSTTQIEKKKIITRFDALTECKMISKNIYVEINNYIKRLFLSDIIPYQGPLCGYLDFLYPIINGLRKTSSFPKDKPFFLLIDDADNLNLPQTRILNTWVSFRTSAEISLKISTQLKYKTYRTVSGQTIDTPHDYSEINIATVYTSSKHKYYDRIKSIVEKRIEIYLKKQIDATVFFPPDKKQESEINQIAEAIRINYPNEGKGATPADDVKRYATPNYIRALKIKKSGSTYSYAGFKQLVSISSGVIRYFLEPASLMFSEMVGKNPQKDVSFINPSVQDQIIQDYSDDYILKDFEKYFIEEHNQSENIEAMIDGEYLRKSDKLRNLISGLGGMFHSILISNASERRVFSIALSSKPDQELDEILRMGVEYGYFQESTIGNKQGTGRTKLYILNRLLSPHFKLDPTSFAGYKFLKSEVLKESLSNPQGFVAKIRDNLAKSTNPDMAEEIFQLSLFD